MFDRLQFVTLPNLHSAIHYRQNRPFLVFQLEFMRMCSSEESLRDSSLKIKGHWLLIVSGWLLPK